MPINIAQKIRPFSHQPGSFVLLPMTTYACQLFPTRIRLIEEAEEHPIHLGEALFALPSPALEWTVQQDLERQVIAIWGKTEKGFFRYWILPPEQKQGKPRLWIEKDACATVAVVSQGPFEHVCEPPLFSKALCLPRLSCGCHRKQEWELVKRRADPLEFLPLWYRLGKQIPDAGPVQPVHVGKKLLEALAANGNRRADASLQIMKEVWNACFRCLLFPVRKDDWYQGILPDEEYSGSPLAIVSKGASIIEQWFWEKEENCLKLLPNLPHALFCGRWTDVAVPGIGTLALEWRKQTLRRLFFSPEQEISSPFIFPKEIRQFRLRIGKSTKGKMISTKEPIVYSSESTYQLDRFQT